MIIRPALDPEGSDGARLRVRDPETMVFLADVGEEKPRSEYWLRRLVEGGVEEQVDGKWPTQIVQEEAPTPSHDDAARWDAAKADAATPATPEETAA